MTRQLVASPQVRLTVAINGYDDGMSTGEVRRFLGDSLGPSDYRKNASTISRTIRACDANLIDLLDLRFPVGCKRSEAMDAFRLVRGDRADSHSDFLKTLQEVIAAVDPATMQNIAVRLDRFATVGDDMLSSFNFSDCSLGNLVFAGCYLTRDRQFNDAIDDYCSLLGIPPGTVVNVTDGTNAYLVAIDHENRLLATEADIVDRTRRNRIKELHLVDCPPTRWNLVLDNEPELHEQLAAHSVRPALNPQLAKRIAEADIVVYAPGTQHSSLFPSYLTAGLGMAIARNQSAVKILVTNIQEDTDIAGVSAIDILKMALHYFEVWENKSIPAPFLITHYLINDPMRVDPERPYVPLGMIDFIEDPRMARIANFEDGLTGLHNAEKVLTPFIESFARKETRLTVAVLLLETESLVKLLQTVMETVRAGIKEVKVDPIFFYHSAEFLDPELSGMVPVRLRNIADLKPDREEAIRSLLNGDRYDFVMLFDSSGMYRGEDIVGVLSLLSGGRLDSVWGSRRLSVRDIRESYQLRYKRSWWIGTVSYLGSYVLSMSYLLFYGRYISDTLSGVRAVRTQYLVDPSIDLGDKRLNFNILSRVLRNRGEIFETPVRFFSQSPEKVKRTTVADGLRCLFAILKWRFCK